MVAPSGGAAGRFNSLAIAGHRGLCRSASACAQRKKKNVSVRRERLMVGNAFLSPRDLCTGDRLETR
jgi:hypothetical protein